jgi:hypothetical protein
MTSTTTSTIDEQPPSKPYDLLREGLIILLIVSTLVLALSVAFGSPDYPTVNAQDVATRQPLAFLRTSADILAGGHSIQNYGPPYTHNKNAQHVLGLAPAKLFGVTKPIDPEQDFILTPLSRVADLNGSVSAAVSTYQAASPSQRQSWVTAYQSTLDSATVNGTAVQVPAGDYGPVGTMMNGMLSLGRSGLLEGALDAGARQPFTLDFTASLLFFQDNVYNTLASQLHMTGSDWGITHETGRFPGAWWLWPYAFLYQIPPFSSSPNADLLIGIIMVVAFLAVLLVPFIPVVNRLPRWLRIYRFIWRSWYAGPKTREVQSISGRSKPAGRAL